MSSNDVQPVQSIFATKDATLSSNTHHSRPRPRPVLSCHRCRRRKVKCDREEPCKQCISTGHAEECSYNIRPRAAGANSLRNLSGSSSRQSLAAAPAIEAERTNYQTPVTSGTQSEENLKAESLASIQLRLQNLERLCANHAPAGTSASGNENDDRTLNNRSTKADASLSIKPSGPRYHSQNYKKSLFNHFHTPGRFILGGFNDPERAVVWNELRRHYDRFTKARKKRDKRDQASWTLSPVLELLPSREICDEAINSYFSCFEKTLRILHYPSFMDEYRRFWESDETQRIEFKFFIPQLAIIIAIIYTWEGVSMPGCEKELQADVICGHVGEWLDTLRGRKQLTLATLRTQALLILSQQVRSAQTDEMWRATGKLLRSAMVAGLHRDPSEFPNINIFEGELRRRLWMTVVELDLGASLICGMPTMIHEGDFTCNSPSNVDDIDLFDSMTEFPLLKPLFESTDSILQIALAKSLHVRLRSIHGSFTRVEDVQPLIHALEKYIQDLPPSLQPSRGSKDVPKQTLGIVLLHVYIRRVLSHLHHASISLTDLAPETITSGVQSSLSILSYQKLLDIENSNAETDQQQSSWELFHILCKNDIMQAALDICIHAKSPDLVSWTKASLLLAIDDTIANLIRRISKNGNDIKDVLRLSVISQMLKSQVQGRDREEMMKEGAVNVLMACRNAARLEKVHSETDRAENDFHHPTSPDTQLVLESGNAVMDWTTMSDPLLASNGLEAYLGMDGGNYDFLDAYTLGGSSSQSDMWSQY